MTPFQNMIAERKARGLHICVGLDVEYARLPEAHRKKFDLSPDGKFDALAHFTADVAFETSEFALAFKPNYAFGEGEEQETGSGWRSDPEVGYRALRDSLARIRLNTPKVPVIVDRKAGDIGNTNKGTVKRVFDILKADATTIAPYMGYDDSMDSFLNREDKFSFVLCLTSNKGAAELQKKPIVIEDPDEFVEIAHYSHKGEIRGITINPGHQPALILPQFLYVAHRAVKHWNRRGNVGLVVGATHPSELEMVCRMVAGTGVLLLIPGSKKQGGRFEDIIPILKRMGCMDQAVINLSREVLYPPEGEPDDGFGFADKAFERLRVAHEQIGELLAAA